jgi:hypothetical protein
MLGRSRVASDTSVPVLAARHLETAPTRTSGALDDTPVSPLDDYERRFCRHRHPRHRRLVRGFIAASLQIFQVYGYPCPTADRLLRSSHLHSFPLRR